jgi:hypothetical protein
MVSLAAVQGAVAGARLQRRTQSRSCTLRCALPAHTRPFLQSASQQLRSSRGSPRARSRIRRVSRGMQPRLCLQPAPPQLHSLTPRRQRAIPIPSLKGFLQH